MRIQLQRNYVGTILILTARLPACLWQFHTLCLHVAYLFEWVTTAKTHDDSLTTNESNEQQLDDERICCDTFYAVTASRDVYDSPSSCNSSDAVVLNDKKTMFPRYCTEKKK